MHHTTRAPSLCLGYPPEEMFTPFAHYDELPSVEFKANGPPCPVRQALRPDSSVLRGYWRPRYALSLSPTRRTSSGRVPGLSSEDLGVCDVCRNGRSTVQSCSRAHCSVSRGRSSRTRYQMGRPGLEGARGAREQSPRPSVRLSAFQESFGQSQLVVHMCKFYITNLVYRYLPRSGYLPQKESKIRMKTIDHERLS
ncbi:hypothetical protein DENSPDRAFT_429593 [Dentipellis sp. KUC8613]|nr:hypothetical protein DENSPDRAFT_429593 [Dentipellis sp. KUC8613]